MVRQLLNATDTRDLFTLFKYINNTATQSLFFPVMLLVIWMIAAIGVIADGKPLSRGMTFASFICSIVSILLVIMDVLAPTYMYLCFILTAVGVFWMSLTSGFD